MNKNGLWRNKSTTFQILTNRRILEDARAKKLVVTLSFVNFSQSFDSIHRGKMEKILLPNDLPIETVAAIMMRYKKNKVKARSPDAGVLQGDTLAP